MTVHIKEILVEAMNNNNLRAVDTLINLLDKENQAEEEKLAPIFNINVSDPEDIKKIKKLLK